jgi:hypothetical protein
LRGGVRLRATGVPSSPSAPRQAWPAPRGFRSLPTLAQGRELRGPGRPCPRPPAHPLGPAPSAWISTRGSAAGRRWRPSPRFSFLALFVLPPTSAKPARRPPRLRTGLRDTRKRDATGSPSRCGRLGSRYSPSFAKGPIGNACPLGGRQDAAAGRADAADPRPMLIRMVHVRPSLGPIPQPRQPRTLIRVP